MMGMKPSDSNAEPASWLDRAEEALTKQDLLVLKQHLQAAMAMLDDDDQDAADAEEFIDIRLQGFETWRGDSGE